MTSASLSEWEQRFPVNDFIAESGPVHSDSVFFFTATTAPLPSAVFFGSWNWFSSPREAADYLRYVALPDLLAIWFCRDQWDSDTAHRRDSTSILEAAEAHGFLVEDLPLARGLVERLQESPDASDDSCNLTVAETCQSFTARFGETPTWELRLEFFSDLASAAERLWADGMVPEPLDQRTWRDLCQRTSGDPEAQRRVAAIFSGAEYV